MNTDLISGEGFHAVSVYLEQKIPTHDVGQKKQSAEAGKEASKEKKLKADKPSSSLKTTGRQSEPAPKIRKMKAEGRLSDSGPRSKKARIADAEDHADDDT